MVKGDVKIYSVSFDAASINSATTAEQDITVSGVGANDILLSVVIPSSLNAGLGVVGARVKQADTITLRFMNATGGALNPGALTFIFYVCIYNGVGGYL